MKKIAYHLNWPFYARIPHAVNAIRAGNLLFLSGCTGLDPNGNLVGPDIASQTRQAMENMKAALAAAGASFKNVVHMDTFYADPRLSPQMIEARSSYFGPDNPYTTTGVQVAGFGRPGILVEMDAIAVLDDANDTGRTTRHPARTRSAQTPHGSRRRAPSRSRRH